MASYSRPSPPRPGALVRLSLSLVLLCLATLPALTDAALFSPNTKVTMLTGSNFKREVLDIEKPTMVAFTAPWCGHCQRLVPEYEKAAKQLDGVVKLANIDCDDDKNKPLCGQYGIQGFPTLKVFPPTKKRLPRDYQGPRTAKDIAAHLVDTLPMGAKKLRAEELQSYCEKEPDRPKVLLFSTKPTSSALYKSLALDFRTSISFAFLRGDQPAARAASRAHLGVSIDEGELPVLLVVPSRAEGSSLLESKPKRYDGPLKYHELHRWLLDNVPEAASKKPSGAAKKATAKATAKVKAKAKDAAKKKADADRKKKQQKGSAGDVGEEKLPRGAQYEWRAENEPDSKERKEKLDEIAAMLGKAAQRTKDEAGRAAEAAGSAYESVKQKVLDSSSSDAGAEYADSAPAGSSSSSHRGHSDSEGSERHSSSSWSSSSSYSSVTDEDGKTTEDTEASYRSSSSEDPKEHSYRVSSHREAPSEAERASLREQLTKWLDGQKVDWSSQYADQFDKAAAAAKELMEKDPEEARKVAVRGEEFLLSHLETDLAMMEKARANGVEDESISDEKIEQVRRMVGELEKRVAERTKEEEEGQQQQSGHDEL
ncbi:uncharacterized protein PFL1_05330 [Pseudozyma flocculosa PF-1]|uniref:Related to MPD1 - Disulfide isomerase related protein n=2 Tax=Pseudozyma flocculosa TaxID=84751 RepID=A0A5C3FCG0_9BASI|nr:uncharacterized protein PFL1_05330 [Pseudozyma flocculosa PF-1]EPQ27046.1 hypothetical protein PFL1_05330 [Pseudozyma flocculosa PF-1]SPO42123.1 related to MPD1 - Disulfide isomerase related protein [Pseudozyma flocculosa]